MDFHLFIIGLVGGALAGGMNTMAGFGSIITLSILMELMGLPANVANGTNRMSIVFASALGAYTFHKNGKLDLIKGKWYFIFMFLGAMLGIYLALIVSNEQFKVIFKFFIIFLFFILLLNPKKLLREVSEDYQMPLYISAPVFFALGIYGGFIQMGTGIFFLAAIVMLGRYNLVEGNGLKLFAVTAYTIIALFLFWMEGLVDWSAGLAITIGQIIGTMSTARFASKYKNANLWAYRILLIIVVGVILHFFGILKYMVNLVGI